MKTLIRGGYVVGFNGKNHEVLKDGVVVFENDTISFVGFSYPGPVDKTIDAKKKLIIPGFVNTHIYSVYDITRVREDLGFFPQFTLGKAIEDY